MQKKKLLVTYYGDTPECVEGFPKDCRRSCKGSLMFRRGKNATITDDEYKFICTSKSYSHMKSKLRLVAEMADKPEPKKEEKKDEKSSEKKDGETDSGAGSTSSNESSSAKKKTRKKNR